MDPLTANLITAVVPAALVAGAVIATVAMGRRRPEGGALTRTESWVTSIIGGGAMLTAVLCLLGAWGNASWIFGVEPFSVDGMRYSGVTSPEVLGGVGHVAASGYESVWAEVIGLPAGARWLFYAELVLPLLSTFAIAVVVAWLAFTVVRERPFARALPIGIGVAAVAIMVGGLGSQFAGALARSAVIDYLGVDQLVKDSGPGPATESFSYFSVEVDLAPIGWALGLLLVAAAFQIGARLQRETDLLV